jgi:regulatory associated protein of mTOR
MPSKEASNKDRIDRIPGRQTDRKTLLGELNWIFTSITDTIAWNMLPRVLFQKLFRQDLLLASLFRNFMLAERIMRACGCQPVSSPRLPPLHQHPLWDTWDVHAEAALLQLPAVMADEQKFVASSFFREQLTAFELWLNNAGGISRAPPQQLPIVLQVLLSQVHRVRALHLLGRFLDMGSVCVELALSVGIFPYVLKLLQTTLPGLRRSLVFIWCKILATDKQCQQVCTHLPRLDCTPSCHTMSPALASPLPCCSALCGAPLTPCTPCTVHAAHALCVCVLRRTSSKTTATPISWRCCERHSTMARPAVSC